MLYIPNLEEYIYICIKGMESRLILEYTKAGATVENINFDAFQKILLPIPPENQIQRIIDATNDTDEVIGKLKTDQEDLIDIIDKTKSKILDLAIHGKLVPQNPDDEPASTLLERIKAEKEELIKAGKIKRDKKESVIFKGEDNSYYEKFDDGEIKCIDEDVPFELPESWCWCRLGTLFAHNTGKALNSSDSAGTLMTYITTSNLYWDRFELDSLKEMPFTESEIDKCTVTKGDLLVCEGGDIGRSAIWMFDNDIRIQNHIHRLRPYISLSNRFYYYVLYMWKQMGLIGGQGIGLQGFSSKALHNLIVPLPPIKAQETIVAFVDEINHKLTSIENSLT
jgi:type I restriction enzyme S subunit